MLAQCARRRTAPSPCCISHYLPGPLFLAGSGLAILLFNGILLNPVSRTILVAVAVGWGLWTVLARPEIRRAGWYGVAGGGIMLLFGSLLQNLVHVGGIALIAAGGISFVGSLLRRGARRLKSR